MEIRNRPLSWNYTHYDRNIWKVSTQIQHQRIITYWWPEAQIIQENSANMLERKWWRTQTYILMGRFVLVIVSLFKTSCFRRLVVLIRTRLPQTNESTPVGYTKTVERSSGWYGGILGHAQGNMNYNCICMDKWFCWWKFRINAGNIPFEPYALSCALIVWWLLRFNLTTVVMCFLLRAPWSFVFFE